MVFVDIQNSKKICFFEGYLSAMISKILLQEFQNFLLAHRLAPEKNVPYYALWASRFLAFANKTEHTVKINDK
jgi:hypothetical protein